MCDILKMEIDKNVDLKMQRILSLFKPVLMRQISII